MEQISGHFLHAGNFCGSIIFILNICAEGMILFLLFNRKIFQYENASTLLLLSFVVIIYSPFPIHCVQDFNCIAIDWRMTETLVLLRSMNDFVYFLNILLQVISQYLAMKHRHMHDHQIILTGQHQKYLNTPSIKSIGAIEFDSYLPLFLKCAIPYIRINYI